MASFLGGINLFFPHLITKITPTDHVLEIGPGALPYPRSDVFLELRFKDENIEKAQRGNEELPSYHRPVVFYDGGRFPFNDNEFDYIICSHVIEHVEDVEEFISELFRVGKKGYLEYPTVYYEYLYNFKVHLNLCKLRDGKLHYMKKSATVLNDLLPIQKFFYQSLEKGYNELVDQLKHFMFEGFEWNEPFPLKKTDSIEDIIITHPQIDMRINKKKNGKKVNIKKIFRNILPLFK